MWPGPENKWKLTNNGQGSWASLAVHAGNISQELVFQPTLHVHLNIFVVDHIDLHYSIDRGQNEDAFCLLLNWSNTA